MGRYKSRYSLPTTALNAAADAECPDGKEDESGCSSLRLSGTSESGRGRRTRFFAARLVTAEVIPTATSASTATSRPRRPPTAASRAALPIHSTELLATLDKAGMVRSRKGVFQPATARNRAVSASSNSPSASRLLVCASVGSVVSVGSAAFTGAVEAVVSGVPVGLFAFEGSAFIEGSMSDESTGVVDC